MNKKQQRYLLQAFAGILSLITLAMVFVFLPQSYWFVGIVSVIILAVILIRVAKAL